MNVLGRFLIIFGGFVVLAGVLLTFSRHIPLLGKLPGDILFEKGSLKIYFPIVTSLVLSAVLTILANLFMRR
jgi:hypothetical protein